MVPAISRLATLVVASTVARTSLVLAPMVHAVGIGQGDSAPGQVVAHDGSSAATAAVSCWDIKQCNPSASDEVYRLQTPAMDHPAQFFCDQTTDGGGWVMIGRGREGWEAWSDGKGDPAKLTTRGRDANALDVVQLSNDTMNQLLNNVSVEDQADGVRVMRLSSPSGHSYQSLDIRFQKMTDFVWPFKMAYPISILMDKHGPVSDIIWNTSGYDQGWNVLQVYPSVRTGWQIGWDYGPVAASWGGDVISRSSFLRKFGQTVFPYVEVYMRPCLSSEDASFSRISDEGLPASTVTRAVSQHIVKILWDMNGNPSGSYAEGNTQVQAFAQVGSTMYTGDNLIGVKQGDKGTEISSCDLTAFDVPTGDSTGQTFDFNVQVKALLALPDGRFFVSGDFTQVNGQTHVETAVVDPSTGQVDSSWSLQVSNALRGGAVSARLLAYHDGNVHTGGSFTHLSGGGRPEVCARSAGCVDPSLYPDRSWNPGINGSVQAVGVPEANSSFHAGSHFIKTYGTECAWYAAKFSIQSGAAQDTSSVFEPSTTTAGKYQQIIATAGNRVYIGGSEHSLFGYDAGSNKHVSGLVTLSRGGDLQASTTSSKGIIYASCHRPDASYQDMYSRQMDSSRSCVDEIKWAGAWNVATDENLKWTSSELFSRHKTDAWVLTIDNCGNLRVGGDFTLSHADATCTQWSGGFVRYDSRDNTTPETPPYLRSFVSNDSTVTPAWKGIADAASYEILRDGRPVVTSEITAVEVPRGGENRYFVRAVDAEGNRSVIIAVYTALAPSQTDVSSPVLLKADATWNYHSDASAAPKNWAQVSFDDSAWPIGVAPLSYGDSAIATQIATKGSRPMTAYHRAHSRVADVKGLKSTNVKYLVDDGAVVHINGIEVDRTRMGAGMVSYMTCADAAPNFAAASASSSEIFVPVSALRTGDSVIAVETHVNYMHTATVAMQASIFRVGGTSDDNSSASTERSIEPTDATQPINVAPAKSGIVIRAEDEWNYWTSMDALAFDWVTTGSLQSWNRGSGPIDWGDSAVITALDIAKKDRAITYYFACDIDLGPITPNTTLTVKVRAGDGVVLRVNGTTIGTKRMSGGKITHTTYANSAVSAAKAASDLLEVTIPTSLLTSGVNHIGVEEYLNHKGSPSMTFDLNAILVK